MDANRMLMSQNNLKGIFKFPFCHDPGPNALMYCKCLAVINSGKKVNKTLKYIDEKVARSKKNRHI
jgi:hypothetical protein